MEYARAWVETNRLIRAKKFDQAYPRLSDLMASSLFEELPSAERHTWIYAAAELGRESGDFKHAHPLFVTASELPEAERADWDGRYDVALRLRDTQDAIYAITTLVRRWPESLADYNSTPIRRLAVGFGPARADEESRMKLLEALYAAKWKIDFGVEPSGLWQELARMLVERGRAEQASDVLAHVTDPRGILAVRVDNRFDALVRAQPPRFDVGAVVERNLAEWRAIVAGNPRTLQATSELAARALDYGRYEEALTVTSEALAKLAAGKPSAKVYDDLDSEINWIRDTRAHSLMRLGKGEDAERELRHAASLLEQGQPNVSNTINLAVFYVRRGQASEALRTLGPDLRSGKAVSGYGAMQVRYVLHAAAVEKKDVRAARESLGYMREHQADALSAFQESLLVGNELNEAAELLVRRLEDTELRSDALAEAQEYRESALMPLEKQVREAWRQLRQRDDVRAAIAKVGRIEQFPLPPQ
jgi:tetratricopeptide (TPR) repeat protein